MTRCERRVEDMGSGSLEVLQCDDGDIHVTVREDGELGFGQSVEFCLSGCDSPRTHRALIDLLDAMAADRKDRPQEGRR